MMKTFSRVFCPHPPPTPVRLLYFANYYSKSRASVDSSVRLRKILRPFISWRGAQIVFKTINTIAGSETGGPIYPVAALNAEDKTNDNTVCLL